MLNEKSPEVVIHLKSIIATRKKVPSWKTLGHIGIYGFCFEKFAFIHHILALELSRCLEEINIAE